MLQLCQVTSALLISDARSACSAALLQQEAVTLCINVSKRQPFPAAAAPTPTPTQTPTPTPTTTPTPSRTLTLLRVPVYDDPAQDLYAHMDACADAIHREAQAGGRSLVYCKNGRSRSAAVCIAYLMKHRRLSLSQAHQKVKTSRHVIEPNSGFMAQLQRYEQDLRVRQAAAQS